MYTYNRVEPDSKSDLCKVSAAYRHPRSGVAPSFALTRLCRHLPGRSLRSAIVVSGQRKNHGPGYRACKSSRTCIPLRISKYLQASASISAKPTYRSSFESKPKTQEKKSEPWSIKVRVAGELLPDMLRRNMTCSRRDIRIVSKIR